MPRAKKVIEEKKRPDREERKKEEEEEDDESWDALDLMDEMDLPEDETLY